MRSGSSACSPIGSPGSKRPSTSRPKTLLEGDGADQLLDVDAAIAQRAAVAVGLGDLGRERDDALEPGLDLAHGADSTRRLRAPPASVASRARVADDLMFRGTGRARGARARRRDARRGSWSSTRWSGSRSSTRASARSSQVDPTARSRPPTAIAAGDPRPFAGVPIAIKNNRAVAGLRLTQGCSLLRDFIAPYDHSVVRRLRAAGFVIVGTTKLPEYGILPVTEPHVYGPARNPWDPARTPGGSSGGAAAAVASGMVPIAHGNDGGGSLRIPAACCGLVGLKAQRHRVSTAPDLGASLLVIDGVLTRTRRRDRDDARPARRLRDRRRRLDRAAGGAVRDERGARAARACGSPSRRCRRSPRRAVDPLCAAAVERACALAESLGHHVEEIAPPWQDERAGRALPRLLRRAGRARDPLLGDRRRRAASRRRRTWSR